MCYVPVDVCPICTKRKMGELVTCQELEPQSVCVSVSIPAMRSEDRFAHSEGYIHLPVRMVQNGSEEKVRYYIAVEDVIELAYADIICDECEKARSNIDMDEWEKL